MAATPGYKTIVKFGTSAGSLTAVGQAKSADLTTNAGIYDITVFGDNWKDIIAGINDYSIKCGANFDLAADAVQTTLLNAYLNGTLLYWSISPNNGTNNFTGQGYLKSMPMKFPVNNVSDIEFDLDGNGPLAYA